MKIAKSSKELQLLSKALLEKNLPVIEKSLEKTVLVTGGAGFLGVHLLYELALNADFEKIYTIVRSAEKLKAQALKYIGKTDWLKVVHPIEKDLTNIAEFDLPRVSLVIHSAAEIHCLKSLTQLYQNNCEVTANLLSFYKSTPFIFISSLSVFVSSSLKGCHYPVMFQENDNFDIYGGYAQSKYISELNCYPLENTKIVRLGLLTGSTDKGLCGHDFFTTFLKNCKKLQCYPSGFEESFVDITPVDICAQKIVKEIVPQSAKIFHIANKRSLPLSLILKKLNLSSIPKEKWLEKLKELSSLDQVLMKYAFFKEESLKNYPNFFNIDLFQSTGHSYNIESEFDKSNEELLCLYLTVLDESNHA